MAKKPTDARLDIKTACAGTSFAELLANPAPVIFFAESRNTKCLLRVTSAGVAGLGFPHRLTNPAFDCATDPDPRYFSAPWKTARRPQYRWDRRERFVSAPRPSHRGTGHWQ
jgi:hypothetical protein